MADGIAFACTVFRAQLQRERRVVMASRIAWSYCLGCALWGLAGSPLSGIGHVDTGIWFLLPVLLYGIPPVALLAGVAALQGDAGEEDLILSRVPSRLPRLLGKWIAWSGLLALATFCMVVPLLPSTANPGGLLQLWAYSGGEIAVFVAVGLLLGRIFKDPAFAHSAALVAAMAAIAGGGLAGYVAAWQPLMHRFPDLWTLLLMAHPVEALRVSIVYSVEDLPFDARELPQVAGWWLRHPGLWYFLLSTAGSAAALGLAAFNGRRYRAQ